MNIVYLIGNGFDRNLNLKTDYQSFYNYYIAQESKCSAISNLKNEIHSDYKNWADLEEALGKYLNKISTEEDAKTIHKDLLEQLQKYIYREDSKYLPPEDSSKNIFNELFYPVKSLRPNQRRELKNGLLKTEQHRNLYIISFNYTQTIERLTGYTGEQIKAFHYNNGYAGYLREIEHIHGYCDSTKGRMALGVDNPSQICNESLSSSRSICYRFVKPTYNDLYGDEHHQKCYNWINKADFICIFGMSIGITDQTWWHAIGKKILTSNARLLYFYFEGFELDNNNGPEFQEQIDSIKDSLLPKLGIEDISNQDIRGRIYISCDKTMFKYVAAEQSTD